MYKFDLHEVRYICIYLYITPIKYIITKSHNSSFFISSTLDKQYYDCSFYLITKLLFGNLFYNKRLNLVITAESK